MNEREYKEEDFVTIYNGSEDNPSLEEDEIVNDEYYAKKNERKEPSKVLMTSAAATVMYQKTIGKAFRKGYEYIKNKPEQFKKGLVSGALTATILLSGTFVTAKVVGRNREVNNISTIRTEELVKDGTFVREGNDVSINLENSDRYKGVLPYGTNPGSEKAREYYSEIMNTCKNSNVSVDAELRMFLSSFVERGSEQTDEGYYNYITKLINDIKSGRYNPTYNPIDFVVGSEVFTYDGEYENNSIRR